jgi:hypothetical protein
LLGLRPYYASRRNASLADRLAGWVLEMDLGRHAMKGVARPQELFTLDPG